MLFFLKKNKYWKSAPQNVISLQPGGFRSLQVIMWKKKTFFWTDKKAGSQGRKKTRLKVSCMIILARCVLCLPCDSSAVNGNGAANLCFVWAISQLPGTGGFVSQNIGKYHRKGKDSTACLLGFTSAENTLPCKRTVTTSCCAAVTLVWVCLPVVGCTAIPGGGGVRHGLFSLKEKKLSLGLDRS